MMKQAAHNTLFIITLILTVFISAALSSAPSHDLSSDNANTMTASSRIHQANNLDCTNVESIANCPHYSSPCTDSCCGQFCGHLAAMLSNSDSNSTVHFSHYRIHFDADNVLSPYKQNVLRPPIS